MNRKILTLSITIFTSIMLLALLVECVPAKPTTATVDFRIETWGDANDPNTKMKSFVAGESENTIMKMINIVGNLPLLDGATPTVPDFLIGRGGVRLIIDPEGSAPYTLDGDVDQLLITFGIVSGGALTTEKSTFTIKSVVDGQAPAGAIGSTLELSLHAKDGIGKIVGNRGTGIFENTQFRGTYIMTPTLVPLPTGAMAVFKVQAGSGELVFR
jgi:hypothetical protein